MKISVITGYEPASKTTSAHVKKTIDGSRITKKNEKENNSVKNTKRIIPDSDPLCVVAKCLSDDDVAQINKIGILPVYAKVSEVKDGFEIRLATGEQDGEHTLPKGFILKNTDSGKTIIAKI